VLFWYNQLKIYSNILRLNDINISQEEIMLLFIHYVWLPIATTKTGLEINADRTKYMAMPRSQYAGRRHSIKTDNSSSERDKEFKY